MFDFYLEIKQPINQIKFIDPSLKKGGIFSQTNYEEVKHQKSPLNLIGYTYKGVEPFILDNDNIFVCWVGLIYPTISTSEKWGYEKKLNPDEISHLYNNYGCDIIKYIKGNFALIIYDKIHYKVYSFTGKSGLLKLFYYDFGKGLILSTSIDSIINSQYYKREIEHIAVYETLIFGYPLGNITYGKNIFVLDNHSYLIYDTNNTKLSISKYYDFTNILSSKYKYNWEETYKLTPELFNKAVDILVNGEDKINEALTGGFDSRTLLSRTYQIKDRIQFYSWGSSLKSYDVKVPLSIAQKFKLNYKWIQFGNEFLKDYITYAEQLQYLSDGFGNIKRCNQMYSKKLLSEYARFNVTGAIGSELLRPNNGLDTNILPAMKDIVFQNAISKDRISNNIKKLNSFYNNEFKIQLQDDVINHIYIELCKYMVFEESYLNLYNYTISQSLWKFFGQEFHSSRIFEFTVTPYSDDDFIEFIVQTPVPNLNQHAFERNAKDLKNGQLFYLSILKTNLPQLTKIKTNRGYTPAQLQSCLYPINILIPFLLVRLDSKYLNKTSAYNATSWNKEIYKRKEEVLMYSDKIFQCIDPNNVSDREYSLKSWILEYLM